MIILSPILASTIFKEYQTHLAPVPVSLYTGSLLYFLCVSNASMFLELRATICLTYAILRRRATTAASGH